MHVCILKELLCDQGMAFFFSSPSQLDMMHTGVCVSVCVRKREQLRMTHVIIIDFDPFDVCISIDTQYTLKLNNNSINWMCKLFLLSQNFSLINKSTNKQNNNKKTYENNNGLI